MHKSNRLHNKSVADSCTCRVGYGNIPTGENVSTGLVLLQVSSMTAFLLKTALAVLMFFIGIYGASMSDTRGIFVTQLFGMFTFNMAGNMILFFLAKKFYEIIHNDKKFDRIISKLKNA